MTSETIRLHEIDLVVGEPLGYDVYDGRDRLLLNRGHVLASLEQIERLLERGAYGIRPEVEAWRRARGYAVEPEIESERPEQVDVSPFDWIGQIRQRLETLLAAPPEDGSFEGAVRAIAEAVQKCVDTDVDASIASILIAREQRYAVRHLFNAALLSEIVSRHHLKDASERIPLVCAALTMNMTILGLQDVLYSQTAPLSTAQRAEIIWHPQDAVGRLRSLGVADAIWLSSVGEHHESLDGKGYPQRLASNAIGINSQLIAIVDQYCALVSERATRAGVLPSIALRKLFLERQPFDTTLAAILVRELGLYPPGALVRLANGDLALVVRRTNNANTPIVRGLVNANRRMLHDFPKWLTSKAAFAISEVLPVDKMPRLLDTQERIVDPAALWQKTTADAQDDRDIADLGETVSN